MFKKRYTKTLAGASLFLVFLILGVSQAAEIVVNTDDTWSDDSGFSAGDTVVVNSAATLTVDGDAAGKTLASIALASPASSGIGTLTLTADGELSVGTLILGDDNDGNLNLAAGSTFSVNEITFNRGTIVNEGLQYWNSKTINWNNTNPIIFDGSGGLIYFGTQASGQSLTLLDGTLNTTGDLDADDFTLTGGLVQVAGDLTFNQQLTLGGGALELQTGSTWTMDQDQSAGTIIVSGGTVTLEMAQNFQTGGGSISMSDGIIDMGSYDLNLGDADVSSITGGSIVSGTLGGSTVSWNTGTVEGRIYSFFNAAYYTDNANVAIGGDAVIDVIDENPSDTQPGYTVTYDFTLSGTATVTGTGNLLYAQAGATITSTGGTNTADFIFLGRNDQSIFIDSGATFEGSIDVANGISNEIRNGTFNGEVTIANPGDSSTGPNIPNVPVGVGVTEVSGGTFNNLVTLDLSVREDVTPDTQYKATISGGTFNGNVTTANALLVEGTGAALISGGTFNNVVLFIESGNKTISGGTFNDTVSVAGSGTNTISGGTFTDLLEFTGTGTTTLSGGTIADIDVQEAATGTVQVSSNVTVNGTTGVTLSGGTLNIVTGGSLNITTGELLMQSTSGNGGTFTGEGALVGNINMSSGTLAGNLTITGNVTQTGGTIAPGNSIGTTTITGDLVLADTTIEVGESGTSDTIVVGGQTTLSNGGTMTVTPLSSSILFEDGDQYTVVQSTGAITDAGYSVLSAVAGFNALGEIVGNNYVVTLQRSINVFPAGAHNANHVAEYLYDLYYAGDPQNEVMNAIQSDSNQQMAAEKVAGESHMSGMQNLMNSGIVRMHTLTNKIRPNMNSRFFEMGMANNGEATIRAQFDPHAEFERTSVWYAGYGMGGHIVGDANTASTELSFSGMMVGIEGVYASGSKKLGFFYDRSYAGTDVNSLQARNDIDTNFFGAYHTSEMENGYRLMTLGFGQDQYRSRRNMALGSGSNALSEVAQASYHGWQTTFYVERGYELQGDLNRLQPFVSMQYSYIRRNGFEETGAQYTGLDVGAESYDSLRGYLGARWDTPFLEIGRDRRTGQSLGGFIQLQTAWIHEMLNKTAPISNAHLGASTLSNNFLVEGADCGRDWWLFSVGTKWRLAKALSLYGDYTLLLNGRESLHTGSGGLSLSW